MTRLRRNLRSVCAEILALARRYALLDAAGLVLGVVAASAAHAATGRTDLLVLAAIAGENVGFYGMAAVRHKLAGKGGTCTVRALWREFALAECIDFALVRPVALVLATQALGPVAVAVVSGGLVADLVYYTIASRCARPTTAAAVRSSR